MIRKIKLNKWLKSIGLKDHLITNCSGLMWRTDSLVKTLMMGKTESRRRRGRQRMMVGWHHWLDGHEFEQALGVGDGQGGLACYCPWGRRVRHDWATELNWTGLSYVSVDIVLPTFLAGGRIECGRQILPMSQRKKRQKSVTNQTREDDDKSYRTDLHLAQPELGLRKVAFMANGGIGA